MFDWNDEELTNIIWGEAGESDDHIVPYPDQVEVKPSIVVGDPPKKEINQQTSNSSPSEVKNPPTKAEQGVKKESNCKCDTGEPETGFGHTSWSDGDGPDGSHLSSSSNVSEAKLDSVRAAVSHDITKSSECGSVIDETVKFNKDGEQGDIVDYGWANIGSFDDLDRIFGNQDPLFGDMSTEHADGLWSPSKDVPCSPIGTTPLSEDSSDPPFGAPRTSTRRSEVKAEYMFQDTSEPFGYKSLNEITSHAPQDIQTPVTSGRNEACLQQLNVGSAAPIKFPSKANRQKRLLKGQKVGKKSEVGQLDNLSGMWPSSGSTCATSTINPGPPLVLTQQSSLPSHEPFQQKYFSGSSVGTPLYGNLVNHYPVTSALPQFHPGDENHEMMSSSYEVPSSSLNLRKPDDAAAKPLAMTPREKIEKLRRRQQMRAILAIQKQQLQFGNQVSVSENPGTEGTEIEVNKSLESFPSLGPNSPACSYDSSTISMNFDNCSVEESVLYLLQDTIAKLDMHIRLCIRDSLSRLARSAVQRLYHNDSSINSTSTRDEVIGNKDLVIGERFIRMPNVETDTNPIDRVVAHLLFRRPLDFSGKPSDAPDSPLSPSNLPNMNTQTTSPHGSKTAGVFSQGDEPRNCPDFVTSENMPEAEDTNGARTKVQTSSK